MSEHRVLRRLKWGRVCSGPGVLGGTELLSCVGVRSGGTGKEVDSWTMSSGELRLVGEDVCPPVLSFLGLFFLNLSCSPPSFWPWFPSPVPFPTFPFSAAFPGDSDSREQVGSGTSKISNVLFSSSRFA